MIFSWFRDICRSLQRSFLSLSVGPWILYNHISVSSCTCSHCDFNLPEWCSSPSIDQHTPLTLWHQGISSTLSLTFFELIDEIFSKSSSKAPLRGTLLRTFLPADVVSYRTALCKLLFHQHSPHFTVLYLIPIFPSSNNELSCGIIPKSRPTADPCVESHCMRERYQVHLAWLLWIWMLFNPFSIYVPFLVVCLFF